MAIVVSYAIQQDVVPAVSHVVQQSMVSAVCHAVLQGYGYCSFLY